MPTTMMMTMTIMMVIVVMMSVFQSSLGTSGRWGAGWGGAQ
jgi:hypothetical protein